MLTLMLIRNLNFTQDEQEQIMKIAIFTRV